MSRYILRQNNGSPDETFASRRAALAWARKKLSTSGRIICSHSYCADTSDARQTGESLYERHADMVADTNGGRELAVLYRLEAQP